MVYLEAAIQGFFLKVVIRFMYTRVIHVGGSFPVKLQAVCLPFWWKSTHFILILHVWRALFESGFLINNWYCVSCLLNINSAMAV